ncbi:sigma-70 family RNA polymerase sigma factor [Sphingomonas sp.]|uniref:sigma-70 family RNA polymerase sigma factor n=1 Tax=Sphingomonas sp. TaxID=28214 RepID=UPI000DAF7BFE|nr:MAG: RNA polymerase subunit sigma-24 [Sphingomonas sp.]
MGETATFAGWQLEDLLASVADQDRAAFAELYRRTAPKLYGIMLRILGEPAKTDEAVQDAYVRIWRSAGGYDAARGRPITWLATIARNIAIDRRRAEISRGAAQTVDFDLDMIAHRDGDGATSEELAALRVCLERLDPEQRQMVIAAYLGGDSREELAERTGRPVGTIKSWLHRSLAQLRTCLGG